MKAMVISRTSQLAENTNALDLVDFPKPVPSDQEVLIRVVVCGVCHTELDEIEGRTPPPSFPMVPGHQAVGKVVEVGPHVTHLKVGDRVGVAWIYSACGTCTYCQSDRENLCQQFRATGRDAPGGYAEYIKVQEAFAYQIPPALSDTDAAPLLCAGAIGYRSLRLTALRNGQNLGLTGFGASAHLVMKMVKHKFPETKVYVFARSKKEQRFALDLGAVWSGDTNDQPPELLDAIIDTTPVWSPVVEALQRLKPGGRLVINAIRKESIDQDALLQLNYPKHLWMEKEIKSVANVTRKDVRDFLQLAADIPVKPHIQEYSLEQANQALLDLKYKHVWGAKVLRIG
ncbi:MAG: zinc-dependent alcohol dehydrogenase family protein [Cyclobacteriaceae bacterium]